jgi:hypothetical protein
VNTELRIPDMYIAKCLVLRVFKYGHVKGETAHYSLPEKLYTSLSQFMCNHLYEKNVIKCKMCDLMVKVGIRVGIDGFSLDRKDSRKHADDLGQIFQCLCKGCNA